jgi:hypothetical protein
VLYWFRTPPGVRVGRSPIDEDAIRLLEQHNPDVQFDWTRILKDPAPAEPARREGRPREGRDRRREERPRPRPSEPMAATARRGAPPVVDQGDHSDPADHGHDDHHRHDEHEEYEELTGYADPVEAAADTAPADVPPVAATPLSYVEEAAAQLRSVETESPVESGEPAEDETEEAAPEVTLAAFSAADEGSASYQRLGAEGLVRLRARYAEVMARIAEQPSERLTDDAREQLKLRAERLNPDGWVTADEVAAALEQYESVFEELRALVGREPRRRHRRRR